jgi:putative hemolysin
MPTNKYWQDRFTQLEGQAHRNAAQTLAQLEQAYKQAQAEIEKQTLHWYQRFADNNGITISFNSALFASFHLSTVPTR